MKYNYDAIIVGLGPSGMNAAGVMLKMGLKVIAIEKNRLGGECLNIGCIPSKGLIEYGRKNILGAKIKNPMGKMMEHLTYIRDKKTARTLEKLEVLQEEAKFVNSNTIEAGTRKISAKKIFIAVGTTPFVPEIEGIKEVSYLTIDNIFSLKKIPESMIIVGGGSVGTEMAQAFSRLGCKIILIQDKEHILPIAEDSAVEFLEEKFENENITVLDSRNVVKIKQKDNNIVLETDRGESISSEKLFMATGKKPNFENLNLKKANIKTNKKGFILVNKFLQTSRKNIFAIGDCNGLSQFSHSAMQQGLVAVANAILPICKVNFNKSIIPWTIFTDPEISHTGMTFDELSDSNIKFETIEVKYESFGGAIVQEKIPGYVRVYASKMGKVYGATIVGHNSGEMINEWTLIIQNKISLFKLLMTVHSFPTMGMLSKSIAEKWAMFKLKNKILKRIIRILF